MSELIRSVHRLAVTPLSVLALAVVACATAEEPDGVGAYHPQPSAGGLGGAATASGGGNNLPLSGTTNVGGGNTSNMGTNTGGTGVLPSGGKPSNSGTGTAGLPATGGTSTTGGTGTAGTCPPYTGTLAKDSLTFTGGFGKATTGMWSGYGYTYKYGAATIAPGMGTSCFAAAKFCANGSVPADDKSGAGLGWNIGQAIGAATTTKVPVKTGVKLSFAGAAVGMRVQLSASATVSYCYALTAAEVTAGAATIAAASFKTECWGDTGVAYDGTTGIEAIQIAVPGSAAGAAQTFDLCVLDIEPG